jgi:hypothetical protein
MELQCFAYLHLKLAKLLSSYFPVFSAGQSIPLTLRELQSCSTKSSPCYVEQCTCAVCLSAKISTSNFQLAQCRLQLSIRPIWMVHLECAKTQNFPKPDPNLKIGVFWVSGRITLIPIWAKPDPNPNFRDFRFRVGFIELINNKNNLHTSFS